MAITAGPINVDDSAPVAISGADTDAVRGQAVAFKNTGSSSCYVGPADVTDTTGYPVDAGEAMGVDLETTGDQLYAICASGESTTLRVLAVGA